MIEDNKIDFGSVGIHQKAIADIVFSAISEIKGVGLVPQDFKARLYELFGREYYTGIVVTIDKNNQIDIEVSILIQYGINVPDMAQRIQEAVKLAIEKMIDVELKEIRVNVQGVKKEDV